MGANQSGQKASDAIQEDQHGITVVRSANRDDQGEERIVLPAKVEPILSIEGHVIDLAKHRAEYQLNKQLWLDLVTTIDRFSNSRAELIANRQNQLQEKIMMVDEQIQKFTDSYINDKHKALAKLNDDCRRVEEMDKMLEKCTIQSELLVDMLKKLNFILPQEQKLESMDF